MLDLKLRIVLNAIKIRIKNNEELDEILKSYPKLTKDEIKSIKAELSV